MKKKINGKEAYPLTVAQKLHFFYQQYCPKKQVLNIGTSLTIQQSLDFNALKEAIYKAYDRCESMRLRFHEDKDGSVWQTVADKEERDIEFFDFTGWEGWAAEWKMKEWTSVPFERFDAPLNRIVMIITPDGFQGMYLLVDHMTMDAQSLIVFMKDVIELYCNMKYEGVDYPKEMYSYIKQLEKDLEYEAGSKAQKKDIEFFEKMIQESEPMFTSIFGAEKLEQERRKEGNPNLRAATLISNNVDANIVTFQLEQEPSLKLLKFCEEQHISMVCLLMMGLRTYLQKENGSEDVSINTTVARRATIAEKKCGGTRIHCFPFRTIVKETDTFMEGLLKIRDGQNQLFRHANYDPTAYFMYRNDYYKLNPGQTYEPMSLTYQPMTLKDKGLDKIGDIKYKALWYSNGAAAQPLYLTVMHRAEDNGINFNFEHQTGFVNYEQLEHFYYYLCRILFAGIENPKMTVGELMRSV
ncbi:MAG: condensation domain-containing protein [Lachnospiraceae bacterium]